jgi:hypothetical protein
MNAVSFAQSTFLNKTPLFLFNMHVLFLQTAVNTHSHFTPTQTHHINDEHNHIYKNSRHSCMLDFIKECLHWEANQLAMFLQLCSLVRKMLFLKTKQFFTLIIMIILDAIYIHALPEPSHVTHDTPQRLNTYTDKKKHTLGPDEWNYLPWRAETLLMIQ